MSEAGTEGLAERVLSENRGSGGILLGGDNLGVMKGLWSGVENLGRVNGLLSDVEDSSASKVLLE